MSLLEDLSELGRRIDAQNAKILRLEAEVAHWKANHDQRARQNRELRDRPDLGDRAESIRRKDERIAALEAFINARPGPRCLQPGANAEALLNGKWVKVGIISARINDSAHPDDIPEGEEFDYRVRDGEGCEWEVISREIRGVP